MRWHNILPPEFQMTSALSSDSEEENGGHNIILLTITIMV